jgi:hypothetical protein
MVVVMAPEPAEQPVPALVARRAAVRGVGVGIGGDGLAADQGDQK